MLVSALFTSVRYDIKDATPTVWVDAELLAFYNEAVKTACQAKPSICATVKTITLAAGSEQTIATPDYKLLEILHNYVADTAGKVVRGPIPMKDMDESYPLWNTATPNGDFTVDEYVVDDIAPRSFWVYPMATVTSSKVRAIVAVLPADASVGTTIPDAILPVIAAIREWILYRCWCGDDENAPTFGRAGRAYEAFFNILGVRVQSDLATSPEVLEK